jgi:3-methyladenine DNA glycosylase AlkC
MARRPEDVNPERRAQLNAGQVEATNLAEALAVDFAQLLRAAVPGADHAAMRAGAGLGVTRRMALAGRLAAEALGTRAFATLASHPSDTVRGWACYALAGQGLALDAALAQVRRLAADRNSGVREWAWLALRPAIAAEPLAAIARLRSWTTEADANLRRFASEATRPRGVWCTHIKALRQDPTPGLVLLEPLRGDPARYVQDSVANWLNDAGKDKPEWVRGVCSRWQELPGTAPRILARGRRNLA